MTTELRAALEQARDALPRVGEQETVYCMLRGDHLRALVEAAERLQRLVESPPAGERELPPFDEAACRAACNICPGNRWDNLPCAKARALAARSDKTWSP